MSEVVIFISDYDDMTVYYLNRIKNHELLRKRVMMFVVNQLQCSLLTILDMCNGSLHMYIIIFDGHLYLDQNIFT